MSTAFNSNKESKSILSCGTLSNDVDSIRSFDVAICKIKSGDIIYNELKDSMSALLKVKKVVNYQNGLAFQYDFMLNRFNKLYKDSWCYSDYCRFATDDEIKLLKKKMKSSKKDL